jgi:hypothetical protein
MKKMFFIFLLLFLTLSIYAFEAIQLARLQYEGGGDWYNDPEIIPNLSEFINDNIPINLDKQEKVLTLTDNDLSRYPFIFVCGHGNILFSDDEVNNLREYLLSGGFLYADDDYGMDTSFRREIKRVFPEKEFVELPLNHQIFNAYYEFKNGLPKIHEHDLKRPQLFALFDENGRIMVLYSYESNISDGWADYNTHNNPDDVRQTALKFGLNIFFYIFNERI